MVAINKFSTDTEKELELVKKLSLEAGAEAAVIATHWEDGGKGAVALGSAVIAACSQPSQFK